MSALGQRQTYAAHKLMSALPPIATAKADSRKRSCLLYPRKRTCAVQRRMSAMGQKRTFDVFDPSQRRIHRRRDKGFGEHNETSEVRMLSTKKIKKILAALRKRMAQRSFSCGDCYRNAQCGLPPHDNCVYRLMQMARDRDHSQGHVRFTARKRTCAVH